jgi:hypothetical protein
MLEPFITINNLWPFVGSESLSNKSRQQREGNAGWQRSCVIDIQYAKHTWFLAVMAFPVPGAGCSADSK